MNALLVAIIFVAALALIGAATNKVSSGHALIILALLIIAWGGVV